MRGAAVVVVLLLAGCGGGAGSPNSAKAVYLHKAEAVCTTVNTQIAAAKKAVPTAVAAVPPYVHRLVGIAQQDVTALSALRPPAQDAAAISAKLLTPLGQQLAEGQAYAAKVDAAAASHDVAALTALVFHPPTTTRVDVPWMRAYGFRECVTAADTGSAAK